MTSVVSAGGLTAVMFTDTAQSVIMVIGAFVVMGLSKLSPAQFES